MVNREDQIKKAFIKLVSKYDVDDIDVNAICESLNIKRQTFYYHYKNIYDLVRDIFLGEKIKDIIDNNINSIIEECYMFLFNNQEFNLMIINSSACDELKDFLFLYIQKNILTILNNYNLRNDDKKTIARFYGKALAEQVIYDFSKGEYSTREGVNKIALFFNDNILNETVRKFQNVIN